ncbi:MAG: HPP family protein [Deltaproteobacteria bacterium]|nr:HPP family protein [Deltaproteobacteria bacterium]
MSAIRDYFRKMKGGGAPPPRVSLGEMGWSFVGAFAGMGLVAWLNYNFLQGTGLILMLGSLGASAFLIFGAIKTPVAQPRNLVGGQVLSAIIGVAAYKICGGQPGLAAALAVAAATAAMLATRTAHPPGGATALIAVIGDEKIHGLGYFYAVMPVGAGVLILLVVALIINNIPKTRRYPEFWI